MEEILKQILFEIKDIKESQVKTNERLEKLEEGQEEIKKELHFMWEDIKILDKRLSKQEEETFMLKRIK